MRFSTTLRTVTLLLAALLLVAVQVRALGDAQAPLQAHVDEDALSSGEKADTNDKPKLFKPKTGIMKEEHDVDPSNQRARADEVILENAEDYQPEGERVINSLEDLS